MHVSAGGIVSIWGAEMAGLAPSGDDALAEHAMLDLDDEIAGLVEAAAVPAGQDGAHSTKPEPTSAVPGKGALWRLSQPDWLTICSAGYNVGAVPRHLVQCCAVLCCAALHKMLSCMAA